MKRVQFNRYGEASEMYMADYQLPKLKRDEVQVRVKVAAINPLDWKQRQGAMKLFMTREFPKGIGSDFAGIVEAVGQDVHSVRIGDEVLGTMDVTKPGAFAEVLITHARLLIKKPTQLSFAEAACLPIPTATAWAALVTKGRISQHSRVFINGCTGAVGFMAVQIAQALGAHVAGTCSPASMAAARIAGVDPVFNYADESFWQSVEPFDIIFDTAGTMNVSLALSKLNPKGVFIDINPTAGRVFRGILSSQYKLVFATMGLKHLSDIVQLATKGQLKPQIGLEAAFSNAVATITEVEKGQRIPGRVVLTV
jgi:NADPH:quinone reductase-like Zn-dependent oxidoreductase